MIRLDRCSFYGETSLFFLLFSFGGKLQRWRIDGEGLGNNVGLGYMIWEKSKNCRVLGDSEMIFKSLFGIGLYILEI